MALLIDSLILAPVKGVVWLARKIQEQAEAEMYDEPGVRQALHALYEQLDNGDISEAEFEEREEDLVDRLEAIQTRKEGR